MEGSKSRIVGRNGGRGLEVRSSFTLSFSRRSRARVFDGKLSMSVRFGVVGRKDSHDESNDRVAFVIGSELE